MNNSNTSDDRQDLRRQDRRAFSPRLSTAREWSLWGTVLALTATGAMWLWAQYLYEPTDDGMDAGSIRHYTMVVHAGFALLFVFAAGTLMYTHMQPAWDQHRNRITGAVISTTLFALVFSGYGLWYAGDDWLVNLTEWMHWITGFGMPLLLLVHVVTGKQRKKAMQTRQ